MTEKQAHISLPMKLMFTACITIVQARDLVCFVPLMIRCIPLEWYRSRLDVLCTLDTGCYEWTTRVTRLESSGSGCGGSEFGFGVTGP